MLPHPINYQQPDVPSTILLTTRQSNMKNQYLKLASVLFIMCFFGKTFARSQKQIDSIYFLVDTNRVSANDRLWNIYSEGIYKYYAIQCPCLKLNGRPTFFHLNEAKGQVIDHTRLKSIKLINLAALIVRSKQFLDKDVDREPDMFFLVEPKGKKYIIHNVDLINPAIHIIPLPDVIEGKPNNAAFERKGLINIDSKDIPKYMNKLVITNGRITNTKVIEGNDITLLQGGINQDFTILIEGKNRNKFDLPETYYKGKQIKVTGRVTEYNGKPVILITDPNQIQLIYTNKTKN